VPSSRLRFAGLAVVGGLLVFLAFPPADCWPLAYVALVPLLYCACRATSWRQAALWGLLAGAAACVPAFAWLASVTVGGWLFLSLYVALYVAAAAVLSRLCERRFPGLWPPVAACAWVGLELVRSRFATGFPWLLYGYTQHAVLPLAQLAALTGVYGLSFLLVFWNAALAQVLLALRQDGGGRWRGALMAGLAACLLVGAFLWGRGAVSRLVIRRGPIVGVVQQNIPRLTSELVTPPDIARIYSLTEPELRALSYSRRLELQARVDAYLDRVFGRVRDEISLAARLSMELASQGVRLLVWPETTVGEPLNPESEAFLTPRARAVQEFAFQTLRRLGRELGCYLCVGAPYLLVERMGERMMGAYGPEAEHNANSAYLFSPEGELMGRYDKMHLVPFGEYVPLRRVLPFLQSLTPMTRQLVPGRTPVIFSSGCFRSSSPSPR